jgi:hypothetical protein
MVERAPHILADNFPDPEIGAQMTAVGAHYGRSPALSPINNGASLQEIASNYLTRRYFIGARDRIPARMDPGEDAAVRADKPDGAAERVVPAAMIFLPRCRPLS